MSKIYAFAVAGLMVTASGALAGGTHSYSISLSSPFCVTANVNVTGQKVTANENDGCQTYIGGGFIGRVKGAGTQAIVGGISSQAPLQGKVLVIHLDYPFVTGGKYAVYVTGDGVALNALGSGTYTVH